MKKIEQRYAHWQSIMDNHESSGLSQEEFCEKNQINFRKFRYYRWQLARRANKAISEKYPEVKLASVSLKQSSDSYKLYIKHPSGIECYIPSDIDKAQLDKLIQGLLIC